MTARTGQQFLDRLRKTSRTVWLGDERVDDVTSHPELAGAAHLVWLRDTLRLGDKFPLKAGLVTSLGFGHVSGLVALVHPQAFLATLDSAQRQDYMARSQARVLAGQHRLASAIAGGRPLYEKPADRRFSNEAPEKKQEAAMLLDPASRLGDDDVYLRPEV